MKRKNYNRPTVQCVELKQRQQLLNSSPQGDLGDSQAPTNYDWDD